MTASPTDETTTATGTYMGSSSWLDIHFRAHQPEYEEAFRMVGYQPGWHVLDAGCGGGSFLSLLADAVGPEGRITAMDLDPENIEMVRNRLAESPRPCPVEATTGDLREIPFPDDTFDAVWIGSVLMYVPDADLPLVLAELRRVVKPGGLIGSKETDGELIRPLPIPREHRAPLYYSDVAITGLLRTRQCLHWFRRAGLEDVWAKSVVVERWAPLDDANRLHILGLLRSGLFMLSKLDPATVSDETRAFWEQQSDPDSPGCIANHPDFAFVVAQVVTVGRVPVEG